MICQDVTFIIVLITETTILPPSGETEIKMDNCNSVTATKAYGKINVKLREIMDSANVSRYSLARKVDVRFEVIDRWYNGQMERVDLDILARICFVLDCKIDDILEYEKQ